MERRKITDAVVVHCTATPQGRDHGVEEVRRWHRARGFEDVGYHYLVRLDGRVEVGRSEELVGAHCPDGGMNRRSVSVCYVGGVSADMSAPQDTRTEAQRRSLRELVRRLQRKYSIPDSRVFGHRDFAPKACPSFDVRTMLTLLAAILMLGCSCTRTIYVPVENREIARDTLMVAKNTVVREVDRDTVVVRESGDTLQVSCTRWRWRERVVRDTVREVSRDTVRVREPVALSVGDSKEQKRRVSTALLSFFCGMILMLIGLIIWKIKKG